MKQAKQYVLSILCTLLLIAADQFTKYLAVTKLKGKDSVPILSDIFELQYLENHGAAFGILQGQKIFFVLITVVIVAVILYIYVRLPKQSRYHLMRLILILFFAGAIGNFIDRVVQNYVVDFFYFSLINFPVFNVADIYVTLAAVFMILAMLFYYKEEEYESLMESLKIHR